MALAANYRATCIGAEGRKTWIYAIHECRWCGQYHGRVVLQQRAPGICTGVCPETQRKMVVLQMSESQAERVAAADRASTGGGR